MSIARHHNEWLSLLDVSGPFLSMPVLLRVFPQGLDALDKAQAAELHLAYDEWVDNQSGLRREPAIHSLWVRYVLERQLGFEKSQLLEGPAIPAHLKATIAEQGETLRPDLAVAGSEGTLHLLICVYPAALGLDKVLQDRRWKASPATRMMELLRAAGVPLGLVTNGEQWMLVNAPRGETTTFVSWYAALWFEEPVTLRAFTTLLAANRFFGVADEDTLEGMLKASADNQQEVTDQLGYQVRRAVEVLIRALDKADQDRGRALLQGIRESDLYESALTVMMRLVFLFSAEERGLLLLGDPIYDQNYAISTLRAQLREAADQQGEEVLERRFDAWCRLTATFRAVYGGIQHDRLNLPAYGGSLFDPNKYPFLEGRRADDTAAENLPTEPDPLPINNRTVLHLLESLQVLRVKVPGGGPAEARRLSFRSLDVEQIGHVYEGLLDHVAVRAEETILGLSGTREKEPEIGLSTLQTERKKGADAFASFLKEQTGRSESALKKALNTDLDAFAAPRLKIACNNDDAVYQAVLPYAALLREDDFGYPTVFLGGSVYITAGATRRATGTHYTPRSLTEPIVQHTLEPLVYEGPAEGWPKEQWRLKEPAEILDLKVCDMAMGSAGFLVQVVRYLSERLVESWDSVAGNAVSTDHRLKITPEGKPATGAPGETIIPSDDEERLILARRIVADRCIYGVDKNPLAVEIAKLSIWLTTMDKGRPFTFLDHALKCGDSLIGANADDFLRWARGWRAAEATLFDSELQNHLETARQKRRELESFQVLDVRDVERKVELLNDAEAAIVRIKRGCDLLVGVRLLALSDREIEELQISLLFPFMAGEEENSESAQAALKTAKQVHAFHWEFEFPEVFSQGGFSAFVGNPPFIGGRRIRETLGDNYRDALYHFFPSSSGNADYCAFFYINGFQKLQQKGTLGLIATNTIAQGDTRQTGLDQIISDHGMIFYAQNNYPWPGQAAVAINIVHIYKGNFSGQCFLDNTTVDFISSYLDSRHVYGVPNILSANEGISHMGSNVVGLGFILTDEEGKQLINKDPRNKEVLFPFINGQDINSSYNQSTSRWVINFHDWPLEHARKYTDCFEIVKERVFPERVSMKGTYSSKWWQFGRRQEKLYVAISSLQFTFICAQVSKYLAITYINTNHVFSHKTIVFASENFGFFAILQSNFHESWVRKYGSTLETRLTYTPTDCFQTFPFPKEKSLDLEKIGKKFHDSRREIMLQRKAGLTDTYNSFHNIKENSADFVQLRGLQIEMDNSVAGAYAWPDINLDHDFYATSQGIRFTISEEARREVLNRLLRLNHERHEEEVRQGLHEKKGKGAQAGASAAGKGGRKPKVDEGQGSLF